MRNWTNISYIWIFFQYSFLHRPSFINVESCQEHARHGVWKALTIFSILIIIIIHSVIKSECSSFRVLSLFLKIFHISLAMGEEWLFYENSLCEFQKNETETHSIEETEVVELGLFLFVLTFSFTVECPQSCFVCF